MRFAIPIKLPSLANLRVNWRKMATLKKKQKEATKLCMFGKILPRLPLVVTITRVGLKILDDDNLASACKYIRDQIAAEVGVDDGSDEYKWEYAQRVGAYSVEVEIKSR